MSINIGQIIALGPKADIDRLYEITETKKVRNGLYSNRKIYLTRLSDGTQWTTTIKASAKRVNWNARLVYAQFITHAEREESLRQSFEEISDAKAADPANHGTVLLDTVLAVSTWKQAWETAEAKNNFSAALWIAARDHQGRYIVGKVSADHNGTMIKFAHAEAVGKITDVPTIDTTTTKEDSMTTMNDGRTFRVTSETRRPGIWGGTEYIIQEASGSDLEGKFYEITRKALTDQMMHNITWLDEGQSVTVSDWDGMSHTITRIS